MSRYRALMWSCTLPGLVCLVALSACSSSGGRFVDPNYHFSFKLPAGWSAPSSGKKIPTPAGPEYVLQFTKPPGMAITVGGRIPGVTSVPNGQVVTNNPARDCPVKCIFYHVAISHLPGLLIRRFDQTGTLTDEYAVVNSSHHAYQLEIRALTMSAALDKGFRKVAGTFAVASGG